MNQEMRKGGNKFSIPKCCDKVQKQIPPCGRKDFSLALISLIISSFRHFDRREESENALTSNG